MSIPPLSSTCRTPGAQFHIRISGSRIEAAVDLPGTMGVPTEDASRLEANIHDAFERLLAPYFTEIADAA